MADILGLASYVQQQGATGKEAGQKSRLAKLYSQALAAPEDQRDSYLPQMAAEDPGFANTARTNFGEQRKQAYDDLGREAGMFVIAAQSGDQATAQQAYQRLAAKAQAAGHQVPPQYDPKMLPMIQKLAGVTAPEGYTLTPGSRRYGPNGELIAEAPLAPASQSVINVPDGRGGTVQMLFDPKTGQFQQPQYGGGQQPAPTDAIPGNTAQAGPAIDLSGQPFYDNVLASIAPMGGVLGSTTGGQHNAGSLHPQGRAVDIPLGASASPQAKANADRMIAELQARGFKVRDERTHPAGQAVWDGPHIHVEAPAGGVASGPRLGYNPPKSATDRAPPGYQWNADHSAMLPIPGGPAEIANAARADAAAAKKAAQAAATEQKSQAAKARQAASAEAADQLVSSIDGLLKSPGFDKLGTVIGDMEIGTPLIRNDAKDAAAQLHNISGQVALATMSRLKALSTQGATGFGSLSGPELKLLQNSIRTLQSDQISNAELKRSLKIIRDTMAKVSGWNPQQSQAAPAANGWGIQKVGN